MVGGGLCRRVPEALPVQLLEPDRPELRVPDRHQTNRELAQARIVADQVIAGKVPDPTSGATHFYASTMSKAPTWVKGAT